MITLLNSFGCYLFFKKLQQSKILVIKFNCGRILGDDIIVGTFVDLKPREGDGLEVNSKIMF